MVCFQFAGQEGSVSVISSSTSTGFIDSTRKISNQHNSLHSKFGEKSMLWPSEGGIGDSDGEMVVEFRMVSDEGAESGENKEDESNHNESGVAFYKLDIQNIHVISFFRAQVRLILISSTLNWFILWIFNIPMHLNIGKLII